MNKVELIPTNDGSPTLKNLKTGESYHSIHGAVTESKHVFIKNGLDAFLHQQSEIRILEIGFGSGLNFFLSLDWAEENKQIISYTSLEPFPLDQDLLREFYADTSFQLYFNSLLPSYHQSEDTLWNSTFINLHLKISRLQDFQSQSKFDLIFYDAFSPTTQPEMWSEERLSSVVNWMEPGAVFTTYCARGYVRRSLEKLGLIVERRTGPPGKREMIVAHK